MNDRLYIEEVGVDLEPCVHAHGHDVDLIMEAYLIIKCSLGISSTYIWDLAFCNRGSDHMFFLDPISWASLSTCPLQSSTPVQPLRWSVVEYYPWYLEDIMPLHYITLSFDGVLPLPCPCHFMLLGCLLIEKTDK